MEWRRLHPRAKGGIHLGSRSVGPAICVSRWQGGTECPLIPAAPLLALAILSPYRLGIEGLK